MKVLLLVAMVLTGCMLESGDDDPALAPDAAASDPVACPDRGHMDPCHIPEFLASPGLTTSWHYTSEVNGYRFIATNLSQTNADAWTESGAPLVGEGFAVHWTLPWINSGPVVIEGAATACSAVAPDTDNVMIVVAWSGARAQTLRCSVGGSVTWRDDYEAQERVFTFNVQFDDGTRWLDRELRTAL